MTRASRFTFLAALAVIVAAPAYAGHWVQKEIKWRISSVGAPWSATAIYVRDTTYNALGGGASDVGDTTADFSLNGATVPPRGIGSVNVNALTGNGVLASQDTCIVAWVVLVSDSTVGTTPTTTSLTAIFDGRVGAFGPPTTLGRWVKADSCLVNGAAGGTLTTGDFQAALPIKSVSTYGNVFRWDKLRARITSATGTMPGCRVFLRYYTENDIEGEYR